MKREWGLGGKKRKWWNTRKGGNTSNSRKRGKHAYLESERSSRLPTELNKKRNWQSNFEERTSSSTKRAKVEGETDFCEHVI